MSSESLSRREPSVPDPFFIMGCPRSGTTLVAQMLDAHPRMAVYLETNYYPFFHSNLRLYGDLEIPANRRRLIRHLQRVIRSQGVEPPALDALEANLVSPSFEGILATLLGLYARGQGKARAGEKTPNHYRYLADILEGFPRSPVIFLMRDPRDVVLSMRKAFGHRIDEACQAWNEAFHRYSTAPRPVYLVRYEELVRDATAQASALCAFLGESFEPQMLRFFEHIPRHIRAIPHIDIGRLDSPVSAGSVGNFQQMPADEIAQIEALCAEGMAAMGYERTTTVPAAAFPPVKPRSAILVVWDRLRYYGTKRERWRRGWSRWRLVLAVRSHYLVTGGWLR